MPFASSASSVNRSLAWSLRTGGEGRVTIKFPFELGWYYEQPCKTFRSLQHRKERTGFRHEYIVLKFVDDSICRLERTGDPDARFTALSSEGSVAHDLAQCFRPEKIDEACLETSEIIAEVVFPRELDLLDVLLVCRAIHEGEKTGNYTLQIFNCYFFCLAIQSALTRLVADWGDSILHEDWTATITKATDTLTGIYQAPVPDGEKQSLWLHIYSLLGSHIEKPAQQLLQTIRKIFDSSSVLAEMNQALNNVLWHSSLDLAADGILESRIRDAMVQVLRGEVSGTRNPNSFESELPRNSNTHQEPPRQNAPPLDDSDHTTITRCKLALKRITLLAASKHKERTRAPNPKRQRSYNGTSPLQLSPKRLHHLSFCRKKTSRPQPAQKSLPATTSPIITRLASIEWVYAHPLVIWVLYTALRLFWILPPDFGQPQQYEPVDARIGSMLAQLQSKQGDFLKNLESVLEEIRAYCETKSSVVWNEFPWSHVHKIVKDHVLKPVVTKETPCLIVSIQVSYPLLHGTRHLAWRCLLRYI